ncbi:MAG: hypothetical protein HYR94_18575 [Chloroflexi bacterium]|nr:hypothetical protein [Chloroflexota bacterium]
MNKRQAWFIAFTANIFTLSIIGTSLLFFTGASAAPPGSAGSVAAAQTGDARQYVSISAMAFGPVSQFAIYYKDVNQQLLTLGNQPRNFTGDNNRFVAPLTLPDLARLSGLTVFGLDADNLGEVRLRLKRCDHNQPRCLILTETASIVEYNAGPFEKASLFNEVIDNNLYVYFLELELTALGDSGLRSVRLDQTGTPLVPPLSGDATSFRLPNQITTQARICTDDLSHLDNPTHYPILIVDGQVFDLVSNTCVTVWGFDIELRRELNTGPSSGTYQFLR